MADTIDCSVSSCFMNTKITSKRKRKRSDSVLWQKPLHQQKCQKGKVTTQTTPQKSSIKQRLRTDLGRSVGVTTATQLVWLTGLRAHLPTNRNSRLIKRTHNIINVNTSFRYANYLDAFVSGRLPWFHIPKGWVSITYDFCTF